jgi:hypothetical protein
MIPYWSIRLSASVKFTGVIDCTGLTFDRGGACISGFASREAAVAWVLHYLDARIVDTAAALLLNEPVCCIVPGKVLL